MVVDYRVMSSRDFAIPDFCSVIPNVPGVARQFSGWASEGRVRPRFLGRANDQFAVSNIRMATPKGCMMKVSVFLFLSCLVCSQATWGQAPVESTTTQELYFYTLPSKQLFWRGEAVVIKLQLYSRSEQP